MLTPQTRQRIKSLRLAASLTAEEAAKRARISAIYWRHIEGGTRKNPSTAVLQRMAEAIGCTVADFYAQDMSSETTSPETTSKSAA